MLKLKISQFMHVSARAHTHTHTHRYIPRLQVVKTATEYIQLDMPWIIQNGGV